MSEHHYDWYTCTKCGLMFTLTYTGYPQRCASLLCDNKTNFIRIYPKVNQITKRNSKQGDK